jgi:hypothetical protein
MEIAQAEQRVSAGQDECLIPLYCMVPEATILELDTSLPEQMYQVLINGRRVQINEKSLALLNYLREPRSEREISEFLGVTGDSVSLDQPIRRFIEVSVEKGILVLSGAVASGPDNLVNVQPKRRNKSYSFFLHKNLFSQELLRPLTNRLSGLFAVNSMIFCGLIILVSHGAVLLHDQFLSSLTPAIFSALSAKEWVWLFVLTIFGLLFHELGHSSACTRYGCTHGDIGIGIYFIYPVFFADVTDTWSLPRLKRAAVDLGGIYFHLMFSSICCLLWFVTQAPIFLLTVYNILLMVLFNLNPFLRFDGYWALVDLTGIPRLDRAPGELCKWIWNRLKSTGGVYRKPDFMEAPLIIRIIVILYTVGMSVFLIYFIYHLILVFLPRIVVAAPELLSGLWTMSTHGQFGADFWKTLLQTLLLAMAVWGLILLHVNVVKYLINVIGFRRRNS